MLIVHVGVHAHSCFHVFMFINNAKLFLSSFTESETFSDYSLNYDDPAGTSDSDFFVPKSMKRKKRRETGM